MARRRLTTAPSGAALAASIDLDTLRGEIGRLVERLAATSGSGAAAAPAG